MAEQDDFYIPEHIDEQVDALLQASSMPDQDLRMAHDLRIALTNPDAQTDAHSLQRVLHQLLEDSHSTHEQSHEFIPSLQLMQQQKHGRIIPMKIAHEPVNRFKPALHFLSTIAAVLVVAALVGSMLLLTRVVHQKGNTITGSANTSASNSLPQGIYTSSTTAVFRLTTQNPPQVTWKQTLPGAEKIISAGNVVYVLQNNTQSKKYAVVELDASTGKVLWTHLFAAQQQASPSSEPTNLLFARNRLYVSWISSPVQEYGKVYVLNAVNGNQLSVATNIPVQTMDVEDGFQTMDTNGSVFATGNRNLQVYNTATWKLLWQASMPEGGANASVHRLKIVNNLIYVIFSNDNEWSNNTKSYIAVYQATTGQQVWQSPSFPGAALYQFAVDQNIVYFGTLNGPTKPSTGTDKPSSGTKGTPFTGNVYAYNIQSNKQLWNTPVNGGAEEPLLVSNGTIYTTIVPGGVVNSHPIALNAATGTIKWESTLDTVVLTSFCISNGILYTSSYSDTNALGNVSITAFSTDTGHKLWEGAQYGVITIVPTE